MIEEVRALLARHLPSYEPLSVVALGAGLDHAAYEVDGRLVVRVRHPGGARAEATGHEADLLALVAARSPVPVPRPVLVDPEAGAIAYEKLPGVPLLGRPVADPTRATPALGALLTALHRTDPAEAAHLVDRDDVPPADWLAEAAGHHRQVADRLPPAARRRVEDFLASPPPPAPTALALCHNDLGAEHLLVDPATGTLTGVIDWADAAITDPAVDLARVLRDLGGRALEATLAHYEAPWTDADRERAAFYARCALLEDLAYGLGEGPAVYAEAAMGNLDHTFA